MHAIPPTQADDLSVFLSAVIDHTAFKRIKSYLDHAKESSDVDVVAGGNCDDSVGYFVEPTICQVQNPHDKLMSEVRANDLVLFLFMIG